MKYVLNQSLDLSLSLALDNDLHVYQASGITIDFRRPVGTLGSWDAASGIVASGLPASGSEVVTCSMLPDVLNEVGNYYVWPKLVFSETNVYYGSATVLEVVNPWENLL